MQADGKILVAGYGGSGFALARYNSDGSLDTSFGTGGKVTTAIGSSAFGYSVAVQADGKILVAGYGGSGFALARYNSDGSLDTSFGTGGIVIGYSDSGQSVAVQADGKILVAGGNALARYTTDGSLDTSFGTGGKVGSPSGNAFFSIALQADGKILVAGSTGSYYSSIALVRYTTNGSLDASFGTSGIVTTAISTSADGYGVAVQADGKILVAGTSDYYKFALARYHSDGSLDSSFDADGIVTTAIGYSVSGNSVAVQADGKILLAGYSDGNFALARYNTNGSLDTRFFHLFNRLDAAPSFTEGGAAVILDSTVSIYDAELSPSHYSGATMTLVRVFSNSEMSLNEGF